MNMLPLKYFIVVAQEKSISRAATRLCVTQQTLSVHMASLEKELGCTLFTRRPSFALTPQGERLLQYSRSLNGLYDSMLQEFSDMGAQRREVLRVGVAHTRSHALMPELLPGFRRENPNVQVVLRERSNEGLLAALLAGHTDVAIARIFSCPPELEMTPLYSERMLVVVPRGLAPQGASCLSDLAHVPFVLNESSDIAGHAAGVEFERAGISPEVVALSDNLETLLGMCAAGMGACLCPDALLEVGLAGRDRSEFLVLPVGEPYPLCIAHRRKPYVAQTVRSFEAFCARHLADLTSKHSINAVSTTK